MEELVSDIPRDHHIVLSFTRLDLVVLTELQSTEGDMDSEAHSDSASSQGGSRYHG